MINYWFPTGIYHSYYSNHTALKEQVLPMIPISPISLDSQQIKGWPFWTKQNQLGSVDPLKQDNLEIQNFTKWVIDEVDNFSKHYNSTASYKISQCWANVYQKGDFQEPHIHPGFDFSAVYFISAPPNSSALVFENPMLSFDMRPIKTNYETELNSTSAIYTPIEGQLIIFRSNLRHGVYPHTSDHPRISLAFNLSEK
jgi:uncharacterized protein (TIGR02466 family)